MRQNYGVKVQKSGAFIRIGASRMANYSTPWPDK